MIMVPKVLDNEMYRLLREDKIDDFNARRAAGEACDFKGVDFRGVDLHGADVRNIDFSDCYFRLANLRGLDMSTCRLEGASIRRVDQDVRGDHHRCQRDSCRNP